MPGLLGDVLPWAFSQGDRAKRYVGGLLGDPVGSMEQTAGLLMDKRREHQALQQQAFADPANPFRITDRPALAQLTDQGMGLLGVAPTGMTINVNALQKQFPELTFDLMQKGNRATLGRVVVPKEQRGQGRGTEFMQTLTRAADDEGTTLMLSPSSDFGGNKARLLEFYKRFGFVPNKGRNIDYEISESMYRLPR